MICSRCYRPITQAAGWIGDMPLGPVCLTRIRGIEEARLRVVPVVRSDENQLPLFGPVNSEPN